MSVELTSYMSQYASLTAEITSSISKIGRLNSDISENRDIDGVSEQDEKLKNIIGQVEKSFEDAEELFHMAIGDQHWQREQARIALSTTASKNIRTRFS